MAPTLKPRRIAPTFRPISGRSVRADWCTSPETAAKVQAMLPEHVTVSALLDLAVGRLMAAHATNPDAANEALEAAEVARRAR
jgi:hypothetical protein